MSRSEFRWNKKRKHYAYIFQEKGEFFKNLLIHSDPSKHKDWTKQKEKDFLKRHTVLYRNPNPNKSLSQKYYVENRIYVDKSSSFEIRKYEWNWDKNDKRKIKD